MCVPRTRERNSRALLLAPISRVPSQTQMPPDIWSYAVVAMTWFSVAVGLLEAFLMLTLFGYACLAHGECWPSRLFALATRDKDMQIHEVHDDKPSHSDDSLTLLQRLQVEEDLARDQGRSRRAAILRALGKRLAVQRQVAALARARCETEETQLHIDTERACSAVVANVDARAGRVGSTRLSSPAPPPMARIAPHSTSQGSLRGRLGTRLEARRVAREEQDQEEEQQRGDKRSACMMTIVLVGTWSLAIGLGAVMTAMRGNE